MNPFLKANAAAQYEQVHVAAWPVYPPASSLKYPDPYTNISETQSELVTPAYAYETGTWTLAPSQLVTREGARLNLPKRLQNDEAAVDAEAAIIGNGFARIYRPDGFRAVEDPPRDFEGIFIVDIDLDENILTKRLADFVCILMKTSALWQCVNQWLWEKGGHYMRPDLIRLLVDKTPKTYLVDANKPNPGQFPSSIQRLGLDKPIPEEEQRAISTGEGMI